MTMTIKKHKPKIKNVIKLTEYLKKIKKYGK